jgi:hypothetical protein
VRSVTRVPVTTTWSSVSASSFVWAHALPLASATRIAIVN